MVGFGAQHVVAMFGATFVFPVVMGLDPNVAVMMSGVATIIFLLIVQGKVPSYLGTSASFVGGVVAIRAAGGDSATVTGAILVAGVVLALCGVAIHYLGVGDHQPHLPAGRDRRRRHADRFRPGVCGGGHLLAAGPLDRADHHAGDVRDHRGLFEGFIGRIGILLGLVAGFVLSWLADLVFGQITSPNGAGRDRRPRPGQPPGRLRAGRLVRAAQLPRPELPGPPRSCWCSRPSSP